MFQPFLCYFSVISRTNLKRDVTRNYFSTHSENIDLLRKFESCTDLQ